MSLTRRYVCTFCDKTFSRKSWYDKHQCEKKRRFEERHNIATIKAHRMFSHWQRRTGLTRGGKEKTMEQFLGSPFFNSFTNLVVFTMNNQIYSPFRYIDWLVDAAIPERKWAKESNLKAFRDYLRETEKPVEQAENSYKTIRTYCEDQGIPVSKFFELVPVTKALEMVRSTKLSPWVLFSYQPAVEQLLTRFKADTLFTLDEHINVDHWLTRVETDTTAAQQVRDFCERTINS